MSDNFFERWSHRKSKAREGVVHEDEVHDDHSLPSAAVVDTQPREVKPPPPTLDDVAALAPDADFTRFVMPEVDDNVKRAALKKLFSDPRFNVMDGLDTYIDDYGKPDPLPATMLRKMAQAAALGLFQEAPRAHEDADLQLQPDDAAGRAGADPGAGHGDDVPA